MPTTSFNPFLSKPSRLVANSSILGRIKDPFVFQKNLDRIAGFISPVAGVKIGIGIFIFGFLCATLLSLPWVDQEQAPIDFYFGVAFLFGTGGVCVALWICLFTERDHVREVIQFLSELQNGGATHRLRVRSRSVIVPFIILYWGQNVMQGLYWGVNLSHTNAIMHAVSNPVLKPLVSALYPVETALLGQMANVTQVTVFTTMLVFSVEWSILGEDIRQAYDEWDFVRIRRAVQDHQKLLEMTMQFRDALKLYLLLTLQMYFFIITYSCFLMVEQLNKSDGQSLFSVVNILVAVISLILFGWFCDLLEDKVNDFGSLVYSTEWYNKLIYRSDQAALYRSRKKNFRMVLMRSQKKIQFTCGNFSDMSLTTSWKVLELCYSSFTLLLAVFKKQ
ncbi:uncharacterized protein LOC131437592 [Malaya genurostris]|uniref:uncharacterized protein LOC131437592 n=1 Tax=Malaya genurostris TaxID=325434 RepID=UPI0026F3DD50|nr:uncharacterized protein LOC131437592 [Malaya genurostris]